jgi:hypothetical protein
MPKIRGGCSRSVGLATGDISSARKCGGRSRVYPGDPIGATIAGVGGRTYVGDCKMAALDTRAFVASGGDFYLCPLSEVQLSRVQRGELLQSLWDGTVVLEQVRRVAAEGQVDELVAEGFSVEVELSALVGEKKFGWRERRWLVRSEAYTQAQEAGLERRLAKAMTALHELVQRKQARSGCRRRN